MDAVPLTIVPPDPSSPPDSGKRKAPEGPSTNAPSASSRGGRKGRKQGARKSSAPPRRQASEEPSEDAEVSTPAAKKLKKTVLRKPFRRTEYDG